VRTQKQLSLNLKTRIAEREQLEQERMARENSRRAARGLQPLKALTDLNGAEPPDAVLTESAEIAADLSGMKGLYLSRLKSNAERPATP
jgi:carboxyl-terminal processing protease